MVLHRPVELPRATGDVACPDFTSIKLLELVAAHTSTKAGLSDSIPVTQSVVGLWCRQEFHANPNKIRHPLCQPHQGICGDFSGGIAVSVAASEFAFFTNGSPAC